MDGFHSRRRTGVERRRGGGGEAGSCPGAKAKTAEWNYSCSIVYNGEDKWIKPSAHGSQFICHRTRTRVAARPPARPATWPRLCTKSRATLTSGHAPKVFETCTVFLGSSSLRGPLEETLFSLLPENDSFDESCFKRLGATLDRKVRRNKRNSRVWVCKILEDNEWYSAK